MGIIDTGMNFYICGMKWLLFFTAAMVAISIAWVTGGSLQLLTNCIISAVQEAVVSICECSCIVVLLTT